jgi:hypothetical protein
MFDNISDKSGSWKLLIRLLSVTFMVYWVYLFANRLDWIAASGFHPQLPGTLLWLPLPHPFELMIGWIGLLGSLILLWLPLSRGAALVLFMALGLATFSDLTSMGALNMNFLFAWAVATLRPSVDRSTGRMPGWPMLLIRLYLVTVYFLSGWRKAVYGNWLDNPEAFLQTISGFYATPLQKMLVDHLPALTWPLLQYGTVVFELSAPLIFLHPFFRHQAIYAGLALHIGIALLMKDLSFFSAQMLVFYLAFTSEVLEPQTSPPRLAVRGRQRR